MQASRSHGQFAHWEEVCIYPERSGESRLQKAGFQVLKWDSFPPELSVLYEATVCCSYPKSRQLLSDVSTKSSEIQPAELSENSCFFKKNGSWKRFSLREAAEVFKAHDPLPLLLATQCSYTVRPRCWRYHLETQTDQKCPLCTGASKVLEGAVQASEEGKTSMHFPSPGLQHQPARARCAHNCNSVMTVKV